MDKKAALIAELEQINNKKRVLSEKIMITPALLVKSLVDDYFKLTIKSDLLVLTFLKGC